MSASDQKKQSKSGRKAAIHAATSSDESQVDAPASPLASVTQPIQQLSPLLQEFTNKMTEQQNNIKQQHMEMRLTEKVCQKEVTTKLSWNTKVTLS